MRNRLLVLTVASLAALSLGLTGCSSTEAAAPATAAAVQGPVAPVAAPASPERIDAATFATIVGGAGVTTIDVRTPDEFGTGHIEGAINYNVEGPDFAAQIAGLDPAGVYAVYCRSGNRSQAAVAAMSQAGINGIYELESGIGGWEAAGLPTVS
ncbi:MAG: rhodanese-like domain-containing protein [Actinobacteria bacterium]|nr:rhodanese-like domain-containing protein [Actinomycetota bacterium]